jgi:hydroxyacylglutathione hydrolase
VRVDRLVVGPLGTNCYIVWAATPDSEPGTPNPEPCLVIDPGAEPDRILTRLARHNLRPELIVATHCHADHIAAVGAVLEAFPEAVFAVGAEEAAWPESPAHNLSYGIGLPIRAPAPTRLLRDGDELSIQPPRHQDSKSENNPVSSCLGGEEPSLVFKVLAVPGHSPGSVALHCAAGRVVFTGDTLWELEIGRGDLPGGSEPQLVESIRAKLFSLPEDTIVHPGHGNRTTVGGEKRNNPWVGGGATG